MSTDPAVTISLVTWNGRRWLPGCLDSVAAQTLDDYELLIFDNGSQDGSLEWLQARAAADPRITLVESAENLGYACGHNRNLEAARGEAVLLLNQDVELDPGFLAAAVTVLEERPEVGSVQGRLRRLSPESERTDILDTTGLEMHRDRRVVSRGQLLRDDGPSAGSAGSVWGVDGAAPVYRRTALEGARLPRASGGTEILDEDFFSYKEDVDLAWRLQRLGWSAWYEPAALAWHARGGGDTGASGWREIVRANMSNPPHVRALSWRNHRLMQVKNEDVRAFLRDLPWIARRELGAWAFMLLLDQRRLTAVPALLRGLPAAMRKRRALARRVVTSSAAVPEGQRRWRVLSLPRPVDKVLTHLRRHGLQTTAARVARELYEAIRESLSRVFASTVVKEVHAGRIQGRLEQPQRGAALSGSTLLVSGWAHAAAGMAEVRVFVDGSAVATTTVDRARPDTALTDARVGDVRISGYAASVELPDDMLLGRHELQVVLRDHEGNTRVVRRFIRRIDRRDEYRRWHARATAHDSVVARLAMERSARTLPDIRLVVIDSGSGDLEATVASIALQVDGRWSATIVPARDRRTEAAAMVAADPGRWSLIDHPETVLADMPASSMVGFLCPGEILAPASVARLGTAAADPEVELVYSDHDQIDALGQHRDPVFAPDWSPARLLAQDYVGGFYLTRVRAGTADLLGAARGADGDGWRYGLLLRQRLQLARVEHVARVLWSAPAVASATREKTELAVTRGVVASEEPDATVEPLPHSGPLPVRRVGWPVGPAGEVSVIVPTTGQPDLVRGLLRTLSDHTSYADVEVIILDNSRGAHPDGIDLLRASGARVLERNEPFNWARLCNAGARVASGSLLLFLNDDIDAPDPSWLGELVCQVTRPGVGVAGAMLRYPAGTIQHAGVLITAYGGGAAHYFEGFEPDARLYLDMQRIVREVSAVTGACMLVRRDLFESVGGFDERLAVSGNDVDLCLRIGRTGSRVVWTPDSVLVHETSVSRAGASSHLGDEDRLRERWALSLAGGDPYSNPNLAQDRTDLVLDPASATRH